jgi:hypothetical protein
VVPTSGLSRTVKAAGHTVQFRRMSQRKVQLAASPKGRVLLELWTRGMQNLTTLEIQRAKSNWTEGEMDNYAAMIPAWLRTVIHLMATPKVKVSEGGFDVRGIDGLLAMKIIVVYDRVKSRDLYDLMVLTRDHGYTLDDIFACIDRYQPIRNKDPEHFKSVVTGVIPLDKNDEGFASNQLNVKMADIYKYFKKLINDHEIRAVQQMRLSS